MYKIIGADQKEYGPVTAAQITQWIAENRANGQTRVQAEGGAEWRPLSSFPEFAAALAGGATPPAAAAAPTGQSSSAPTAEEILSRGDDLFRIGSCVSRGWELLKANFGAIFGGTIVFLLIIGGLTVFAEIPIIGLVATAASLVVSGPLTGGLYRLYLKCIRNRGAGVGEIFSGFQSGFLQLMLAHIVPGLLAALSAMPGGIVIVVAIRAIGLSNPVGVLLLVVGILLALVPAIYFSICWMFTLALVADREMDFSQAMQLSRSVVKKHWGSAFCLGLVVGLVNVAGALACLVGLLVSIPIGFGAFLYAYEDIFGTRTRQDS
ncbi:MAG: DUF4339 domain-containing protein [Verrucomicrobia bacterium]|nr:DUF4339 domain-containing protein [Verrucomicrobiota bacterium]